MPACHYDAPRFQVGRQSKLQFDDPNEPEIASCTYNDEGFASRPNLYELPMRWIVAPSHKVKLDQAGE